ncbi:MAG: anthranilate phosphoribosyltransferase [Phycisphaerales bacterium]
MTDTRLGPPEFQRPSPPDLGSSFATLLAGGSLSSAETQAAFEVMVSGNAHESEIGAFLALLAMRIPTSDELLGAARVMRAHVDPVPTTLDRSRLIDTAGTGGAPKMFNVSTIAAIIAAGAGAKVAKHGNRSRTGRGSAEVLAQLGVNVDADRDTQARCLEEAGICFCFAIHHHPATRHVIGARKALGFATIFNLLGPLTNPAGAGRQVMGVYRKEFVRPIAEALLALGSIRAMVLHSEDGLDECSISAPTHVAHVQDGAVHEERIDPAALGFKPAPLSALQARDLEDAAAIFRNILSGEESGPRENIAILNAAATLMVADLADSIADGVARARSAIADGAAARALQQLIDVSNGDGASA